MTRALTFLALFTAGCAANAEPSSLAIGVVESDLLQTRGALAQAEGQLEQLYAAASEDAQTHAMAVQELAQVQQSLSATEARKASMARDLAAAQARVQQLSVELATAQATAAQVGPLQGDLAALQGQLQQAQRASTQLQAQVDRLHGAEHQLRAAHSDLARLGTELGQLQGQAYDQAQRLREQRDRAQGLSADNARLARDVAGLADEKRSWMQERRDLRSKLAAFEQGRSDDAVLQAELAKLKQENQRLKAQLAAQAPAKGPTSTPVVAATAPARPEGHRVASR